MKNAKTKANSLLIICTLVTIIISMICFAGCDGLFEEEVVTPPTDTAPNTGDITASIVEYKGPIKNVKEMIQYESKTVYDNLNSQIAGIIDSSKPVSECKNHWIITTSNDTTISNITLYSVYTPDPNKPDEYIFRNVVFNNNISFGDILINKRQNFSISSGGKIKSKAEYEKNLVLAKAVATDYDINHDDIFYANVLIKKKPTEQPTDSTMTPTTHQHVKVVFYVKTSVKVVEMDILAGENVEELKAHYDQHQILNAKPVNEHKMGNYYVDSTATNVEYPA